MGAPATTTPDRRRRAGAALLALGLVVGAVGFLGVGTSSAATGLDFAAAAPGTYDHLDPPANATATFGYGDGSNAFVVEQLEGGDYDCEQIVPFFTKLDLGDVPSVDLVYTFDRFTTGHKDGTPGVGYRDVVGVAASTDDALHDATNATLTWGESADATSTYATATVSGLEADDVYILRVDVRIGCDVGADPKDSSGNLHAAVDADTQGGAQTIPMRSAANVVVPEEAASLTIVKNSVPDGPQDFAFRLSTTETVFVLDDDADPTRSNQVTVGPLDPGSYTVTETAVPGWSFTSAVCDDGTSSTVTAAVTVELAAGDDVTCTFTNTQQSSSIIIVDTTLPPTTTTAPPTTVAIVDAVVITPEPTSPPPTVRVLGVQLARTGDPTLVLIAVAGLLLSAGGALVVSGQARRVP